jgi:hypothetical protein
MGTLLVGIQLIGEGAALLNLAWRIRETQQHLARAGSRGKRLPISTANTTRDQLQPEIRALPAPIRLMPRKIPLLQTVTYVDVSVQRTDQVKAV